MSGISGAAENNQHVSNSRQVREVVLVEKPRHLVDDKEDLERLFPRCPPNTLESVGRQNKKSKQQQQQRSPGAACTNNNNNHIESESESVDQKLATPLVANIIDLDFNSNDDQVNEHNRRYHQQISSRGATVGVLSPTTSDSTKSTPAKNIEKAFDVMSTTCSSASSTASTKGSSSDERSLNKTRHSGARGVSAKNWTPEMEGTTPAGPGTGPMTIAPPAVGLRDTKIEIAGGREVYHQSRARSGRHKHGSKQQRHSGDFTQQAGSPEDSNSKRRSTGYLYENHFGEQVEKRPSKSRPTATANVCSPQSQHSFIKETVFSSEIHSIEYRDTSSSSGGILAASPGRRNLIYETDLGTASEVVFDDIEEIVPDENSPTNSSANCCDVNVTYDLLQGEFPPPSLGGLSVKIEEDEDLLSSQHPLGVDMSSVGQSLDNLCLGAEANYGSESSVAPSMNEKIDQASTRIIGGITIAEYDGSPRRYRPRGSNETASNASSNSDISKTSTGGNAVATVKMPSVSRTGRHSLKMPGFPQRVLPPPETTSSVNTSPVAMKKETEINASHVEEEELLKFDDIPPPVKSVKNISSKSEFTRKGDDYDLRYEFSETRKVLDEFFQSSNDQNCLNEIGEILNKSNEEAERDFNDLEYTLRRRSPLSHEPGGSSYVAQRLAADEGQDALASPCSIQSDLIGGCRMTNQDLLSMCSGSENRKADQQDEPRGLTGLTMMVGQTRLNVEPAPVDVDCCDEIEGDDLQHLNPSTSLGLASSAASTNAQANVHTSVITNDFTLSPEMTDCDSADLESEMSINEGSYHSSGPRMHTSMPVLEDGLSSGHASDLEDDVIYSSSGNVMLKKQQQQQQQQQHQQQQPSTTPNLQNMLYGSQQQQQKRPPVTATTTTSSSTTPSSGGTPNKNGSAKVNNNNKHVTNQEGVSQQQQQLMTTARRVQQHHKSSSPGQSPKGRSSQRTADKDLHSGTPPTSGSSAGGESELSPNAADPASVAAALKDIKMAIQATRVLQHQTRIPVQSSPSSNNHRNSVQSSAPVSAPVNTPAAVVSSPTVTVTTNHHGPDDPWVRQTSSLRTTSINSVVTSNATPAVLSSPALTSTKDEVSGSSAVAPQAITTTFSATGTMSTSSASNQTNEDVTNSVSVASRLAEEDLEDLEDVDEENELEEEDEEEEESESEIGEERVPTPKTKEGEEDLDTDQETDRLLGQQYNDDNGYYDSKVWRRPYACRVAGPLDPGSEELKQQQRNRQLNGSVVAVPIRPQISQSCQSNLTFTDVSPTSVSGHSYPMSALSSPGGEYMDPLECDSSEINCPACLLQNEVAKKKGTKTKEVLIEGVLFRARYLGSTQLVCEGQPTKATRMMQAEEAVSRIKALAPEGDSQPSTEVDLFISTEKIMVLNTDLKEIMMDHALRTISYIADIGDLLVIMARRRPAPTDDVQVIGTTPKMICHVFESEEAQFIAQSIGQAFQVAYVEFLKANGIEDSSFVKEMDYQEVLNSQEIFNNELALFSSKERQKEVVVPKTKGEILGVVIVESGWGSMLPTIVLANLAPGGPAARCGQLNIGDQVIAINGISLVGLPLSTCQHYIKNAKNKTAVKLTAVSCAPVVEVKIKRPDTKYQLGFSVQNGVICSLLRGGIAERGGVRVGHRIIEINGQSVVAVPHEKIVNLLATSVGEITMKTMPTSMFRLLTGQETPLYI